MIPEVNPEAMAGMKAGQGGIVANPNCSTIIALMAVTPLHRAARIKRMVVSTYQARASSRLCHACVLHHRRARGGDTAAPCGTHLAHYRQHVPGAAPVPL